MKKNLESDLFFVRLYLIKSLQERPAKSREAAIMVLKEQSLREEDSLCRLQIAEGLISYDQIPAAKAILTSLVDDVKVGQQAKERLE